MTQTSRARTVAGMIATTAFFAPLIVGRIESVISGKFALAELWKYLILCGSMLLVSLVSTYFQAMILQKAGQRIVTGLRCDLFDHIEHLSHAQLNEIPVGKLVTRVSNDTEAISRLFTNIIITLAKNSVIIAGVTVAMLVCNYALTLMILCFAPFIVLFTLVFRKFSRRAHLAALSDAGKEVLNEVLGHAA